MYTFREPGNGSDMAIRVDGYMLHVHSIMLRTHSSLLQDLILRGVFLDFKEPLEVVETLLDIMYNDQIDFDRRLLLKVGRLSHKIKTHKVSAKIDAKLASWYEGYDPVADASRLNDVVDDLVFCDANAGSFRLCWKQAFDYIVRWYATYTKWDRYALHKGTNYNDMGWETRFYLLQELLKDKVIDIDECTNSYLGYDLPEWYILVSFFLSPRVPWGSGGLGFPGVPMDSGSFRWIILGPNRAGSPR